MVELSVLGIAPCDDACRALLLLHPRGSNRLLPVKIDSAGASVISELLREPSAPANDHAGSVCEHNGPAARPYGHDFVLNLVAALGAKVVAVDIPHCSGEAAIADQDAFRTGAVLSHAGDLFRAQCRLCEGVALALRCGVPIRVSNSILARTRGSDEVLSGLPEHARAVFEAKIRLSRGNAPLGRLPQSLEKTLEKALLERTGESANENGRNLISVARKMMDDETEEAKEKAAQAFGSENTAGVRPTGAPQIRVALIRQRKDGEAEILNEYRIPAKGLPREVIASIGLSGNQAAAVNAATDEERWAVLLRMLAPETKVLM